MMADVVYPAPPAPVQGLPFIVKLYQILSTPSYRSFISWGNQGLSFVVHDSEAFSKVLPLHFKHNNVSSFARQLNIYGFRKVGEGEFRHELFVRGAPELLGQIRRRSSKQQQKAARVSSALARCMPDAQYHQQQAPTLIGHGDVCAGFSAGGCSGCEPLDLSDEFDLPLSDSALAASAGATAAAPPPGAACRDGLLDAANALPPLSPSPALSLLQRLDFAFGAAEQQRQQRQAELLSSSLLDRQDPAQSLPALSASAMDIVPAAAASPLLATTTSTSLSLMAAPRLAAGATLSAGSAVSERLASLTGPTPAAVGTVSTLDDGELQRLRDMNNLLASRLDKLQKAHEATQGTVGLMLDIVTRSVRDQQLLESRVASLMEQLADCRATISIMLGGTRMGAEATPLDVPSRPALTASAELTAEDLSQQIMKRFEHDEFFRVTDRSDEVFNFFSSVGAPEGR